MTREKLQAMRVAINSCGSPNPKCDQCPYLKYGGYDGRCRMALFADMFDLIIENLERIENTNT